MEIIFLGTSAGTPTKSRNVSAVAVKKANSKLWSLIDCGEATQHQILHTKLSLNKLESIFITHVHGDHCYGLPGLLASASLAGRTTALTIIAPALIQDFVENTQRISKSSLSYKINFIRVEECKEYTAGNDFDVEFVELSHCVPSYAYVFCEKKIQGKLDIAQLQKDGIKAGPCWGEIHKGINQMLPDGRKINASDYILADRKPRKIIVSGDNDAPNLLTDVASCADLLIHEATYTEDISLKVGKAPQHSTAKIIAQFAEEVLINNLILTHFSPRYCRNKSSSPSIADIENEAANYYSGSLFLANDFDLYLLNKDGKLQLFSNKNKPVKQ
ncbi:ribonuclease Z [Psychromonas ossibalaenae]|uniref:ribonuclease Z n=1 Tax=Psychromonas ossibalaenae TaxID=444922 RepID=UPI00036E2DDC|nr:ribonuclease Z [Psychromonas ossibalaenae]